MAVMDCFVAALLAMTGKVLRFSELNSQSGTEDEDD
jgi:hypothetical protein